MDRKRNGKWAGEDGNGKRGNGNGTVPRLLRDK